MDAFADFDFSSYKCGRSINRDLPEDYKYLSFPPGENSLELLGQEMVDRVIAAVNGLYKVHTLVGVEAIGMPIN